MKIKIITFLVLLFSKPVYAQQDSLVTDTLTEIIITQRKTESQIKGNINGIVIWNTEKLNYLPKLLGNADPIRYTQFLSGVQTASEYSTGLYIQGCDNAHNYIAISEVPIYNPNHLLGFFSTFNASHFSQMKFIKSSHSSDFVNRLGGFLNMELMDTVSSKLNGECSVGPISSQGTINLPIGEKSMLTVSLRSAYLNLFYESLLKIDDSQLNYNFNDFNFTYLYTPTKRDKIWLDFYFGEDVVKVKDLKDLSEISAKWKNRVGALHWEHKYRNWAFCNRFYYTRYDSKLKMNDDYFSFKLPAYIEDWGYRGSLKYKIFKFGADIILHDIKPQSPISSKYDSVLIESETVQKTQEYSIYADIKKRLSERYILNVGIRASAYHTYDNNMYYAFDPSFTVTYYTDKVGSFKFHYGLMHQFLFQAGFSSVGLPTEFWYSCNEKNKPQMAHSFSLSYDVSILNIFNLSLEGYYKKLYHQEEYNGSFLDIFSSNYSFDNITIKGSGKNYGINVMLHKTVGNITGWLSYSYGRALRKFNTLQLDKEYSANHERKHELNAVATYRLKKHWEFGTTFVLASGNPFTAISGLYLVNNQIIAKYGEHNSNRLPYYKRLDVSVNYNFKGFKNFEHGVNFSVYNLFRWNNDLFYRIKYYNGQFAYKPIRFITNIIPSINYYCKF